MPNELYRLPPGVRFSIDFRDVLGRTHEQLVHQVREWYSGAAAKVGVFFALPALWITLRIVLLASAEIEVRQLFELEDSGPSEAMKRFRDMGVVTKK